MLQISRVLNDDEYEFDLNLSSPRLQNAFHKALRSGELDSLSIEQWHPWWMPDYKVMKPSENYIDRSISLSELSCDYHGNDNDEDPSIDSSMQQPFTTSTATLDERLLQMPSLTDVTKSSKPPSPLLVYN